MKLYLREGKSKKREGDGRVNECHSRASNALYIEV